MLNKKKIRQERALARRERDAEKYQKALQNNPDDKGTQRKYRIALNDITALRRELGV